MGIFGLFKKNNDENDINKVAKHMKFNDAYEEIIRCVNIIRSFKYDDFSSYENIDDYNDAYDRFVAISNTINHKQFTDTAWKEARKSDKSSTPYYSALGTVIIKNQDLVQSLSNVMRGRIFKIKKKNDGYKEFVSKYGNIPKHEIELSNEKLKRNPIGEMPEIKYTNITKLFNRDKLLSFVVLDTETTGLRASSGRIIQLSAVKYVEWEPVETWDTLINPKKKIPADATAVNGITNEMVADKPTISEVSKSFIDFVGDSDIVGYNLPFDMKFLYAEGFDFSASKKRKFYDVLPLARKTYKEYLNTFKLVDVTDHLGIVYNAHNSLDDCCATGEVFIDIVDEITSL